MRKLLILLLLGLLASPMASYAGIYGTLKGKVVDEENNPVIGASVRIEGTSRGAVVKNDGRFTVVNVPTGTFKVKVSSIGFASYETSIRISADEIAEINVKMKVNQGTTTETLYVDASKEMVQNTDIGRKVKIGSQQLDGIAREGTTAIVGLTAGVFNAGNGYVIRGSRTTETQIKVDGLDVGNQFTGGTGIGGLTYLPMVSQFATEEVQVLTGGFSAEYGDASGGIVNTVAKSGRTDRYEGNLRWRTDVPSLWGSQGYPLKLERIGNRWQAVDDSSKDGFKYAGPNEHNVDFGFGGPIPYLDRSTFYLSGYDRYYQYRNNTLNVKDPAGNDLGRYPNNQSWVKNLSGRMKFAVSKDISVTVGGSMGLSNHEISGWGWLYNKDVGQVSSLWDNLYANGLTKPNTTNIPESMAKQTVLNQVVNSYMVRVNHTLDQNSFYEFTLSNTTNNDEDAKRKNYDDPGYFSGFEVWYPQDQWQVLGGEMIKGQTDKVIDQYTPIIKPKQMSKDKYLVADFPVVNPLTGYYEGASSTAGTQNPYGITGLFNYHGDDNFSFRYGNYWQADGNYTLSKDGQFSHMFKTGFELRFYTLEKHSNSLPWDSNPFFDVYSDRWGGNLYAENDAVKQLTSKAYQPWRGSFYLMDQIKYKGIIITPGLRFDYFNPNSKYRVTDKPEFIRITDQSRFATTDAKWQISPRINIAYPITERSNIKINYGLYFQMPQMQYLYDGYSIEQLRGNQTLGDPNMEAQRTNTYEIAYSNQITDEFAFDVTAYYKDMYNQVGIKYVPAVPTPFYQNAVAEYGNARGLEFTIRKNPADHISFDLNYNLSYAIGTSSDVYDNYLRPVDPYTGKQSFPLGEFATTSDRRHRINMNLMFFWGNNEGPSLAGINILENANISFTTFYQTGTPYTRQDVAGADIGEFHSERQPSLTSTDLRLSKSFRLSDWFGDGAKMSQIEFFAQISNLFNFTGVTGYNARTGDPIDDGVSFRRPVSDFGLTPYFKEANFGRAETLSSEQYDTYGNRFYSEAADFDKSGTVTQEEKWTSYSNFLLDRAQFRGNFMRPRTVYAGIMFRF